MRSFSFKYIQYICIISSNAFKYVHLVSNALKYFQYQIYLFISESGEYMAKQKLTKAAIAFIIEKRNDWNVNYTFDDIAKLLEEDFSITITEQGVSKSYRKYKNIEELKALPIAVENIKSEHNANDRESMHSYTKKERGFEPINVIQKKGRDFDEDAHKEYNFEDFLIPKEE